MTEPHSVSRAVTGAPDKTLTFETGKLAGQADGAVTVRLGDTVVLVTATAASSAREGIDFFPLTVDIEERMYAAGKIPGSFFRREGKASDQAILTCRLIDRPLRPCFPDGFRNEVHVVGTVLGADQVNPHDVLAINGASAALSLSGIPFDGPIGAVRVAYTHRRRVDPVPDLRGGRRVHLRDRRRRSPARRRRRRHHDGRGRRHRSLVAGLRGRRPQGDRRGHRRRASRRPRPGSATRSRTSTSSSSSPVAASRPWPTRVQADYTPEVYDAVAEVGSRPHRRQPGDRRQGRARRGRGRGPRRPSSPSCCRRFEDDRRRRASRSRPPSGRSTKADRAQAHRQRGPAHRRSRRRRHPAAVRRGRRAPDARTAPACSSGARPRCSTSPPSACPAWSRCSTRSASIDAQALHAPLQLPAVLHR